MGEGEDGDRPDRSAPVLEHFGTTGEVRTGLHVGEMRIFAGFPASKPTVRLLPQR